jgi:hypothetical protein
LDLEDVESNLNFPFNIIDIIINNIKLRRMDPWIDRMSEEDLSFVKRFVLASGSLKAMADAYGISYPTVRLRLDRLIERIKIYDSEKITSEFERVLRAQYADGKIDLPTLKTLLDAHKKELEARDELLSPVDELGARAARATARNEQP